MRCTPCGAESPAGARFCMHCAAPFPVACGACGAEVPKDARFCPQCAHPIGVATESAANTRAPARNVASYTPKHLADRILQSRSALEGERKQVTVLFADVKGSMELAEQLDPEEWHQILERFFAILTEGVHRFEGTVNQYTGDGIMAIFGAPIAHEDHAQRACYAALQLRDAVRAYANEVRIEHGIPFGVRIGLNSGEVVVGRIGDDLRMDYTAQGHTVGLAQRMEALAESGHICLSEHTASLVDGYFRLSDLGRTRVKGVGDAVGVFDLEGIGALRTRFDISRARGLSPFVGRDADMQTLEAALEQARAGNGQVVGIVAEAGTGKSRLCFEFLERCKARGLTTQIGRALAHGKNIPLVPMLEVFRAYFGIAEGDADRIVRDRIAGRLLLMDEKFRDLLPVVFEFFGVADPALPMPRLDADSKQRQLFAVLRKVVHEERADGQPVTLIEDLHWIDASSEAFLEQWVEAVAGSHALLILNFRPEYHAAWMSRSWYRQVPLAPLGAEAVRALLAQLLGNDASTAGLAAMIHQRTGGNPFFTEEIVQTLIESGALTGERGRYRLVTPIGQVQVPATVQALLSSRIDRLGEREKQVLQTAAVIGRDFTEPVLQRVLDDTSTTPLSGSDLQSALRTLKDGEFILEQSLYPVAEYTFRHPLTQEVALHSQLQERRRRSHAAVARALQVAHADRLDENAARIAYHHDEANDIANAARWHRRAAEHTGLKDVQAAVRHWLRVRELARQMGEGPEATTLMLAACSGAVALGGWRLGGSVGEWTELLEEGFAVAKRAGDLRALAILTSGYGAVRDQLGGNIRQYRRYPEEAIRIADRSGILSLRCGTRILHAVSYVYTGPLADAERLADELIALADGDPHLGAEVTGVSPLLGAGAVRAQAMGYARDPDAALRELHLLRQIALDSDFPEQALWAVDFEAALRCELDRPDGLRGLAQTAARLAENRGMSSTIASRTSIVSALASGRQWQTLLETAVDTLNLIREFRVVRFFESFFLKHISAAQLELGDLAAARAAAAEGVEQIRKVEVFWSPNCYAALARVQLALHEPGADIAATLDEYAALLTRTGFALFEGELHELRAQLAEREGQTNEQVEALRRAHARYVQFGMSTQAARVQARINTPDAVA